MKYKNKFNLLIIIFSLALILTSISFSTAAERGFENSELIISASELNTKLKTERLRIIDVRNSAKYLLGHIPQSVNIWGDELSNPEGWVPGLIPSPEQFSLVLQEKGINNNSEIVVYDDNNGLWAARLWLIFKIYGHQDIKVLEGGYDFWKESDLETKMLPHSPEKGDFTVNKVNNDWLVNSDTIAENLENPNFIILDTRSEVEFTGEESNSGAPRKGRIPNSIHVEWKEVLNEDNSFKSSEEILDIYQSQGITKDMEVVAPLSHNGVRASHTFFALQLVGYNNLKLYDESWVGWSNRSDLPIERN